MPEQLLPTTVVGSYPQPEWLVDDKVLQVADRAARALKEMWRVAEPYLEQAQDDATLIAIRDMERAGIDIITDGEMRRESYSNRFATALEGVDIDKPAMVKARAGAESKPRCRASSARCAAATRSKCATWNSCAATPIAWPRSRCPARSP